MNKMTDYLKWRGDIPFSVSPVNEADLFLMSKIGAIDWTGIIERDGDPVSFRYAGDQYFQKYGEEGAEKVKLAGVNLIPIIKTACRSRRFEDIRLSGFVNIVDESKTEQFSALTVSLPDDVRYVTFRGTDDNILAWKENFYLSCSDYVSAQRDALSYLRYRSAMFEGPIILGGHSKGGNLAIYAACTSEEAISRRIEAVYSFDGPGFHKEYYDSPGYKKLSSRIHKIVPKNSLVGTLLDNPDGAVTVNSEDFGIKGHDGFNWETSSEGFVRCAELSKSSRVFDTSIDSVLGSMDIESRREFIDSLFEILDSSGATTVTELTGKGTKAMLALGMDLIRNEDTKKFITTVIKQIAKDYVAESQRALREENKAIRKERDAKRQAKSLRDKLEKKKRK